MALAMTVRNHGGGELSALVDSVLEEANETGKGEISVEAHSGFDGVVRELGDALESANR